MQDNTQAAHDQQDPLPSDQHPQKDKPKQDVIITGKKIKNSVMRTLVAEMSKDDGQNKDDLIEMLLLLDQAVEEEMIDEEFLGKIRENPNYLEEYLKEQQDEQGQGDKEDEKDEKDENQGIPD